MIYELNIFALPEQLNSTDLLKRMVSDKLHIVQENIDAVQVVHRSLDARRGIPKWQLKLKVYTDGTQREAEDIFFDYKNVKNRPSVIIVGAGPAGLFAALKLLELGFRPIILERGKSVQERKYDIAKITRAHIVNPDSNWCFGEGGAGTYSDGKLYTRSNKRGSIEEVLQKLVQHGADPDILIDAHAHIGTDRLPGIMSNIRKTIEDCGGAYYFGVRVSDFIIKNDTVRGVIDKGGIHYEGVAVILTTGHSARDIYELFYQKKWALESKPFAMGVRVEHPQQLINEIQYHGKNFSSLLPAASYNLSTQIVGRGVFSFCMCPGGIMVPSATAPGEIVVNGMSNSQRNSPYANAGIVVQVNPSDLSQFQRHGILAGLQIQQELEQKMYTGIAGGLRAPAQRMTDFMNGKTSGFIDKTSYMAGVVAAPIHELLPSFISESLRAAFKEFDKKMRGYLSSEAMLVAVESRTSSPVRILRNKDTMEHVQLKRLYPCGEGAGYAGGITSSAIDGINCAERIAKTYTKDS